MNTLNKGQELLLTVKRLGINGEGIAYYRRLAIFIKGALPGEEVVCKITKVSDKYSEADLLYVKGEKSVDRVEPVCPYYGKCGACDLMHMNYKAQLKFKKDIVMESFQKYYDKELNPVIFKDTIGMESPIRYRNKTKLPVRYDGEKLVSGLYMDQSNVLVYVEDCLLEREDVRETVRECLNILSRNQVIAYHPKNKIGVLRHIVVRASSINSDAEVTLILFKNDKRTIDIAKKLIGIKNVKSVYVSINDDPDSIESFGRETILVEGEPSIIDSLGDLKFKLLPTSFFQLNSKQTIELYNNVLKYGKFKETDNVLDAYCGVGTIGLWLAPHVKSVRGIDNNKEAIINANQNAKLNGISNCSFYTGNILPQYEKFKSEGWNADVIVVDPPRIGLDLRFINLLQKNPVKKIIYVSCNPSTLAKDCNHLKSMYHILQIQVLDMFPNTSNVECVVCLERR